MPTDTSNQLSRSAPRIARLAGIPLPVVILLAGLGLFFVLHPFDGPLNARLDHLTISGDFRREWSALQQFGQGTSIVLISLVIILLDRTRRTRLFDLALALAATGVTVTLMKWFVGRPRPQFGDPATILWPWGTYPMKLDGAGSTIINAHAWDLSLPTHAQLWSMPSSHTAFAVVTAFFLATLYPRLRWLMVFLAAVVAAGRLVFDAHWLTDVAAGATVAATLSAWLIPLGTGRGMARRIGLLKGTAETR